MPFRLGLTITAALLLALSIAATALAAVRSPSGWLLRPAGRQIQVAQTQAGFQGPLGSAMSPDGRMLLSVSSGASRLNSTDLFDLRARTRSSTVLYDARRGLGEAVFYGVVFSPDGRTAWASGGGQNLVHVYSVNGGTLTETGQISTPYFPAGLAYGHTPIGDRIYVANNLSGPPGSTNPPGSQVTVIDPTRNVVVGTIDLGVRRAPMGVTFDRTGKRAYVTNWLGRSVSAIDTRTERVKRTFFLSPSRNPLEADHPAAIAANPVRNEVYSANANSDTVSVIDSRKDKLAATIGVGLVNGRAKGASPSGLAVSPKGDRLYVSLAGENAVAVVDLKRRRTIGFIATAWAPADVDITPNGRTLAVTNTNGIGTGPNPCGPHSARTGCDSQTPVDPQIQTELGRVKTMARGSISLVPVPRTPRALATLTRTVQRNNQARARRTPKPKFLRAIKHVIYVIKENRTYDQVFGSLGKGNGAADLNLFGDESAPNQRELARRFALFDNFYADAEVSADGHQWATQANSTDYVDKTWPIVYSPGPRSQQRRSDFEDVLQHFPSEPLASDPSIWRTAASQTVGYLWDNAYAKRVSFRDYGEYVSGGNCTGGPSASRTTHLDPRYGDHVNPRFPSFDLDCPDHITREPEWEREFAAFDAAHRAHPAGDPMPRLEIVRFPNDHTAGTSAGKPTPQSYMADNDLALGRLVQAVSHSSYWRSTAILVTEDDAQDGPDHVDAHRTEGLVISPFTQLGRVDSTHYDTAAMLATLEDLLGLPPMSIVDGRATRMWRAFGRPGSMAAYDAITPSVVPFGEPGYPVNAKKAPMAAQSAKWNLGEADNAPEIPLNQAIWKSVKGSGSTMPAPRHEQIAGASTGP